MLVRKLFLLVINLAFYTFLTGQASLPFYEDFETGSLDLNVWTPRPNIEGMDGVVEVGPINFASTGSFGARIGKLVDGGTNFTLNALDLAIDASNASTLYLEFDIRDYRDESHPEDGIYLSDGGTAFVKIWDFEPGNWCDGYGSHPPINVGRLAAQSGIGLTESLVIRFQQYDNSDFRTNAGGTNDSDGFALDEVRVYQSDVAYKELPFLENFETGALDSSWAWRSAEQTVLPLTGLVKPTSRFEVGNTFGLDGTFGLIMGKRCDEGTLLTANALDLHLSLGNVTKDVILDFWIRDYDDETNPRDGIYFSNDGGENFVKIWDFEPGSWCGGFGHHPPLNLSKLVENEGLTFSDSCIIRFQQVDNSDFQTNAGQTNDRDGFALDLVQVYESSIEYSGLPFEEDFETATLSNAWAWKAADQTVLPLTGLVKPTSRFEIALNQGLENSFGLIMGKRCDELSLLTANAIDLHLNLKDKQNVILDFWIKDFRDETNPRDGIYLSNDGGDTFMKAWDFDPENWCSGYGQHPPLNVSVLAEELGLNLTEQFIIRFQQVDNADFATNAGQTNDMDGFAIDEVKVYESPIEYFPIPFEDDFETGVLSNAWAWKNAESTVLPLTELVKPTARFEVVNQVGIDNSFGVLLGKRCDETNVFNANALDLHLAIDSLMYDSVVLTFHLTDYRDESHPQDAIFLSTDGGVSFQQILELDPERLPDFQFNRFDLNLSKLSDSLGTSLTEQTIIRFQQYDNADFSTNAGQTNDRDGFVIDSVSVNGDVISSVEQALKYDESISIFPNPATQDIKVIISGVPSTSKSNYRIYDSASRIRIIGLINSSEQNIFIGDLLPGVYYLQIISKNGIFYSPFVKK